MKFYQFSNIIQNNKNKMIPLPLKPKIIKKENNKATIEIENLYPYYGITLGNSLRRVLISSLEGAAITQIKIKGVQHEFSTIPNVLEDVLTIMSNLRQLRFKIFTDEPQKAFLKIKGEKVVKAGNFELSSQIELINKDAIIANLTNKSAELEMEVQIEKGSGYQLAEDRKKMKEKTEAGVIFTDAIFTPIRKVAIRTENMRVGERTDFNRLILEIETDGTIEPEIAFSKASEILANHFSFFADAFQKPEQEIQKNKTKKTNQKNKNNAEKKQKKKTE